MSLPEGRLTRRQILSGAATLPVFAVAQRALAHTPIDDKIAEVETWARTPIPGNQLIDILDKAEADNPGVDRKMFKLVAIVLWDYFALGVERGGEGKITIPSANLIPLAAYTYQTGGKIAQNLAANKFPPTGNHVETNVCAYLCGEHTALAVKYDGKTEVEAKHFEIGYENTRDEVSTLVAQLNNAATLVGGTPHQNHGLGC